MLDWPKFRSAEAFAFAAIVFALAMWRFGATVADPDLWGHVRFGIDKIESGSYLHTDTYSYLTAGSTWFNHEWLSEVAMGAVYLWFGSAGLVVTKALLAGSVIVFLTWMLLNEHIDPLRVTALMLLNVVLLTPTFGTFRPQIFTTVMFTATLFILVLFHRGRTGFVWALPALFALWVNLHGGVLGGIVVVWVWALAYLILSSKKRRWIPLAIAGLSSLALLLNPNGYSHVRFLIETTTVSRPEIVEWEAVDLLGPLGIAYLIMTGILAYALVRSRRQLDWPLVIPLLGLVVAPLVAGRHLQLFVPAVVILGGPYLARIAIRQHEPGEPRPDPSRSAVVILIVFGLAASGFGVGRVAVASSCLAIDASQFEFPARGVAALDEVSLAGNAVVPFNWGQYVIWHLGPEVKVSGDGRRETIYPEAAHQANLDFANGEADWDRILDMAPTDLVIQRTGTPGAELMGREPGWVVAYRDRITTILFAPGASSELSGDESIPEDGDGLCFPVD